MWRSVTNIGDIMFEDSNRLRLISLDRIGPQLLEHFSYFSKVTEVIDEWYAGSLKKLEIEKIDDYNFEAKYSNTTVRFKLLFTYNEQNRPIGRVVALLKHQVDNEDRFDYLGEFSFNEHGQTDLPEDPKNGIRNMRANIDEAVVAYMDKAVAKGPSWLSAAIKRESFNATQS
jgi:hypothetical protein